MDLTSHPHPDDPAPLARLYHENSKITVSSLPYLAESIGEFTADLSEARRAVSGAKTYPGGGRILFPDLRRLPRPKMSLDRVLAARRSCRRFSGEPLDLATLSSLLDHAGGVTGEGAHPEDSSIVQPLRAWPSGGALYPIELYVVAPWIDAAPAGLYHHHPLDRCLEEVKPGSDAASDAWSLVLHGDASFDGGLLIALSACWSRALHKYGERGYRVALLDAGHLAQNLLLTATALGLAACPLAGFHDDALARALGLRPEEEPVLYLVAVGRK